MRSFQATSVSVDSRMSAGMEWLFCSARTSVVLSDNASDESRRDFHTKRCESANERSDCICSRTVATDKLAD
jgi:hypothetical protein